jgi:SAM-dependent methyltransferase
MATAPDWLDELIRCPRCSRAVRRTDDELRCEEGHTFPIRDGYADLWEGPRDDATRRTADSFGFEWTTFHDNNAEDEAFWLRHSQGLDLTGRDAQTALDAGCGKGRYTRFIAPHVGRLVALDASLAVEAAAKNLDELGNVGVVRADLRSVPFAPGSFDLVSSIGVLHHLADPADGFQRLARLVRPGGTMFVYLYSRASTPGVRAAGLRAADALRAATVRLPHTALRWLSIPIAAVLWLTLVGPGRLGERIGIPALRDLPMHTYRRSPFRSLWLDTFDRLSAPIEHRYVWSDLAPWFEQAGLDVVSMRDDAGFYVVATRADT